MFLLIAYKIHTFIFELHKVVFVLYKPHNSRFVNNAIICNSLTMYEKVAVLYSLLLQIINILFCCSVLPK